jgi:hypothetical protein
MSPLAFSLLASIVLTVLLNVGLWLFPGVRRRLHESVTRMAERSADDRPDRTTVRVFFPWKAMLIGSLLLTLLINAVLLARR